MTALRQSGRRYRLSPYERYYRLAGLREYESVFTHNPEIDIEVRTYAERLSNWAGLDAPALRVLDIGCGLGTFTLKLIEALFGLRTRARSHERPRVTFDLNDINRSAFHDFSAALPKLECVRAEVGMTVGTAWQNIADSDLQGPYDLIVANHTLYGAPVNARLMHSLLARLAPGGKLLLSLCSRRSDIYAMRVEAGMHLNTAEDLERELLSTHCNLVRVGYESKFYFDLGQPKFRNWLFATATAGVSEQLRLISRHRRNDGELDYVVNRALVHILEHPSDVDAARGVPADFSREGA